MPIHELGYRAWDGPARPWSLRWWIIAETGIRLAWKSHWLRRMLMVAWLPAIYLGFSIFIYERSMTEPGVRIMASQLISRLPHSDVAAVALQANPDTARREVWALILLTLFRYPQGVLIVLLVGLIAPSLIARDMRSRAFLLYFSRPLERADYVLGKSMIVWVYLALITTVPAMALYILGVFLSPDLSVVADTWDLPLRILGASIWLILPTTAMALCFSSLTNESRYAAFAWFATWALGWVAYANLTFMEARIANRPFNAGMDERWTLVSLYHCFGMVQGWVFGLERDWTRVVPPIVLIMGLTLVALLVLFRRVTAPLRV